MKRRDFFQRSAIGVLGLGFTPSLLVDNWMAKARKEPSLLKQEWILHGNGSFDIVSDEFSILECYPALDSRPVFPLAVGLEASKGGGKLIYSLDKGKLSLSFSSGPNGLILDTSVEGWDMAPHLVFPLSGGRVEGCNRLFKQGMGFAGPSGIIKFPEPEKLRFDPGPVSKDVWSYDSYLVTGLITSGETSLVIGSFDHSNYLQRSTIYNRHRRFGLTDRRTNTNEIFLETGFLMENIPLDPSVKFQLPSLHFIAGVDPFNTLRDFSVILANYNNITLRKAPRYHYCSWYEHEYRFSQDKLDDLLDGLDSIRPAIPFQTLQIDAGYSYLGEWLIPNDRWPDGMEAAFSSIRKADYTAGIWIGPFMVNTNSFIYKQHKDWLLHDREGNIIVEWEKDTHSEGSVCILDTSHPDAFSYLREVFRTMRKWGAGYFKTDFLDWGLQDSTRVNRYTPGKTSVQYFHDVIRMIREEIGEESFWLGCITPFAPVVGYVDAIRVSNDVAPGWSRGGTLNMFREMHWDQYFNNILWQNDPDVFYLRDYNNQLTDDEMETIAFWDGFLGGVVNISDSIHKLHEDRLRFLRFLQPPEKPLTATLLDWPVQDKNIYMASKRLLNGDWGILAVNISGESKPVSVDLKAITGKEAVNTFFWRPGELDHLGMVGHISFELKPHQSRLILASEKGEEVNPGITINGEVKPGIALLMKL
ncbi:MAG: alpha-galactosidase [Bacteroidales bacterium]|nr:alpha-galactosidase [Bacteroidales bacterium]